MTQRNPGLEHSSKWSFSSHWAIFREAGLAEVFIQRPSDVDVAANAAFWMNTSFGALAAALLWVSADSVAKDPSRSERSLPFTPRCFHGGLPRYAAMVRRSRTKWRGEFDASACYSSTMTIPTRVVFLTGRLIGPC